MALRPMLVGAAAAVAVGLGLGVTAAPPAAAGGEDVKARIARHEDGNWKEIITGIDLPSGENKKLFLKVKSRTGSDEEMLLWQPAEIPSYGTKYYKKGENITAEVNTFSGPVPSGFSFTAKPDKYKRFEVKLIEGGGSLGLGPQCLRQLWAIDDGSEPDVQTRVGLDGGTCI